MNKDKRNFILNSEAMFSPDRTHRIQPECVESNYNPYCQHSRNKHLCHLELNKMKCEEKCCEEIKEENKEEVIPEEIKEESKSEIKFTSSQIEFIINPSKVKPKFKW